MKVDVIQVEQAKFQHRFRWWSNWIDVALFDYNSTPFLLQMSVSRTNGKRFNCKRITGSIAYRQCDAAQIGDLTPMRRP